MTARRCSIIWKRRSRPAGSGKSLFGCRSNGSTGPILDFRGYSGLIARGEVYAGMPVTILPSGQVTRIARIATFDGDLARAAVGRSVTLTFADQVDASRGDVVVGVEATPMIAQRISARLFW